VNAIPCNGFHYRESEGDDTVGPSRRTPVSSPRSSRGKAVRRVPLVPIAATIVAAALGGCGDREKVVVKSADTLAVEARAGVFLDYYTAVLDLAQRHATKPDSFRVALEALPGTHLDDREWEAWTRPYRDAPEGLAERLEKTIAEQKPRS
jgi:hypothetical protein